MIRATRGIQRYYNYNNQPVNKNGRCPYLSISGDVIFEQNVGRTDFTGGSATLLKESIVNLSKLDVDYFLPGHMGIIQGSDNVKRNFQSVIENVFPYIS